MSEHGSQTGSPIPDKSIVNCLKAVKDYRSQSISKWEAITPLSNQPLLAWIASRDPLLEAHILQCSMNMTSYSPRQALKDFDDPNQMENRIVSSKKTLMERLDLSDPPHKADHLNPSDGNSMIHSMLGRSKKKLRLPLFQQILSALAPWSKTTPLTSNMHSGPYNLLDHSLHSPNPSGSMSYQEQWSTLMLFSQGSFPPSLMTRLPPPLGISISQSEVANHPRLSKLMETGPSPGIQPPWPSSALSLTEPASYDNTPSTSFSFSEPFQHPTGKSSILTKPYATMLAKSSMLS
jgi:hypothetical protein